MTAFEINLKPHRFIVCVCVRVRVCVLPTQIICLTLTAMMCVVFIKIYCVNCTRLTQKKEREKERIDG